MRKAPPRWASAARSVGAGLLGAAALPPIGFWPAAIVAAAILSRELAQQSAGGRARVGMAYGLGYFSTAVLFAASFTGFGYVILVLAESAYVALGAALVARGPLRACGFVGALTLAEWARESVPFGGLPLGSPAIGEIGGPLAAAARIGGPLGVTFILYATGAVLGELVERGRRLRVQPARVELSGVRGSRGGHSRGGHSRVRPLPSGAVVPALILIAVIAGARLAPSGGAPVAQVRVAAVEGGGPRGLSATETAGSEALERTFATSAELSRPLAIVLWPEDVADLEHGTAGRVVSRLLAGEARRLSTTLFAGTTALVGRSSFLNEIVAYSPEGTRIGTYEKVHPVPFGEYVPLRGLIGHLVNLHSVPLDAVPGHRVGVIATSAGRVGLLVSFESFFADLGRQTVRHGAEALLVPTNTASYATAQVPSEELAASRLDAIATGRDVLQAATVGYSALVDSRGTVLESLPLGSSGDLVASLAFRRGSTLYDDAGDLPVVLLASVALLVSISERALRTRRDHSGQTA